MTIPTTAPAPVPAADGEHAGLRISPLTPAIGAVVEGVNLREPLSDAQITAIREARRDHLMLVFPDQHVTSHEFKAFGASIGQIAPHPVMKNLGGDLEEIHLVDYEADRPKHIDGDIWHSDVTCDKKPPAGAVLMPVLLPPLGGDTIYASMYAAYDTLSSHLQRLLDGMRAEHAISAVRGGMASRNGESIRGVVHPVIRVHPETGRRSIFINDMYTRRIVDMDTTESRRLLEMVLLHCKAPEFQVRLRWEPGMVVVWDNRCTQHYAVADYAGKRTLHRLTFAGETPLGIDDVTEETR